MLPVFILAVVAAAVVLRRVFVRLGTLEHSLTDLRQRLDTRGADRIGESPSVPSAVPPEQAPPPRTEAVSAVELPRSVPQPARPRLPAETVRAPATDPPSLETQIGARWLLYAGVVAIVIGVAYFEKLAFDNAWIGQTARIIQGEVLGLSLLYAGHRFIRAGYGVYGQMICGGGAAILYVSTYASFNFYHLIGRASAFTIMCAITVAAAWLADKHRSQGLAILAVGSGFVTPFLLPATADAEVALFGYDAILIAGTVALARRRAWPVLNLVGYALTVMTAVAWSATFYRPSKYLRTELFFTLFCAMFLFILRESRRRDRRVQVLSWPLWSAPALYYVASLAVLSTTATGMLVWIIGIGFIAAAAIGAGHRRSGLVIWIAAIWPLLLWSDVHAGHWIATGMATIWGIYALALIAHLKTSTGRVLERSEVALLHLNPLATFNAVYLLIVPVERAHLGAIAAAFAVAQAMFAAALWRPSRDQARHFLAVGFTLAAVAIALQFGGTWITIAWAAEGAAVAAVGLREEREWLRGCGLLLFAAAMVRTLGLLASDALTGTPDLLNRRLACAAVVIALAYALAWLHHRRRATVDYGFDMVLLIVGAQLVFFGLLTSEIYSYWGGPGAGLTREMALSVVWAVYATALTLVGLRTRYAPVRYFAIAVFALTIVKVAFVDLAALNTISRVLSVIGLGVALLLTSYLYNRFRQKA
ncbi:MAG TPA: DUF2339 domain-containing protein [Vicinamibacterales bacterium]